MELETDNLDKTEIFRLFCEKFSAHGDIKTELLKIKNILRDFKLDLINRWY